MAELAKTRPAPGAPEAPEPASAEDYSAHSRCILCRGYESCLEFLIASRGSRAEIQELIARHPEQPAFGNRFFHWACVSGNLDAAKELAAAFRIPATIVSTFSYSALRGALAAGHCHVAGWLVAEFQIPPESLAKNIALCREKHLYPECSGSWLRSYFH